MKPLQNFSFYLLGILSVWFINSCELFTVNPPPKKKTKTLSILIIVALPLVIPDIKMAGTRRHMMWCCIYCGIFTFPSYVFSAPDIFIEFPPPKYRFLFIYTQFDEEEGFQSVLSSRTRKYFQGNVISYSLKCYGSSVRQNSIPQSHVSP